MDHRAVIFSKDGIRIYHGINPKDYAGRKDVLIDPVIPRGIPPHEWKLVNGRIEGSPLPPPKKRSFMPLYIALAFAAGLLLRMLF